MYKCEQCDKEFKTFQGKANHVRWKHKDKPFTDEGYKLTDAICRDAIEAYLCIEMSSYYEPTLHPDALAHVGLESQDEAYDWHDRKQSGI